jgi:hypothetical protein
MERIDPIRGSREVGPVELVPITPIERELERERREQARKRRAKTARKPPEGGSEGSRLDVRA